MKLDTGAIIERATLYAVKEYRNKTLCVRDKNRHYAYFFEIEGMPSVLFDKFFQRHFCGITDYHRVVIIPELIKKKYDIRFNG